MADEAPAQAAQPTPETASEIPAVTTPETAPVSTTVPAEELSDKAGKGAGGVEGYLAEKEKALSRHKSTPAPAEAAPVTTEEGIASVVAAPAAAAAEPVAAPEAAAPVAAAAAEPVAETEDKKPDRIRIGALKDGHLVAAATNIAREEGISFADAFERVKPKAAEAAPTDTQASSLRSRDTVKAELATAREERRTAAKSADALEAGAAGKMVEAEEKIETLQAELNEIGSAEERAEQDRQTSAQREFSGKVTESKGLAVQYWPDSGVENSDFSKRMLELSDRYEADPRLAHHVFEADAPFFFAELVAKERGELPVHLRSKPAAAPAAAAPATTQPSTSPATKPAPVAQRAVLRPVQPAAGPASGAARTTQEAPKVDLGIDKIKSVADYDAVKKKLLAGAK